jgi:secondary thiamine-phosphate synthase enzyme
MLLHRHKMRSGQIHLPTARPSRHQTAMQQATTQFAIATNGPSLSEFTRDVQHWLATTGIRTGLLTLFCRHTSASLLIQENAAPEVKLDLLAYFARIAPEGRGLYAHDDEG